MTLYFIRKTVVTLCLNLAIVTVGVFFLPQIASEFIPAIEIPAVAVVFPTTLTGSDKTIHDLIDPVERNLFLTGDIDHIESTIAPEKAIILIYCSWRLRPEECLQRSRQVVSGTPRPPGILAPIFVLHRPSMAPIHRLAIYGDSVANLTQIAQQIAGQVERLPGVSEVRINGASPPASFLEIDPSQASARRVSLSSVIQSAARTWSFRHLFSTSQKQEGSPPDILQIRLDNPHSLGELPVYDEGTRPTRLDWIGKIRSGANPARVLFGKGEAAVILETIKSPGADAVSIIEKASRVISDHLKSNPRLKAMPVYNEAEKILDAQQGVFSNFFSGILLNSFILILFLGSIRSCLIACCVFPTAIFGSLIVLRAFGVSFNIFSLNGFALAAGMITDSSTVVLEAILSRFQKGDNLEGSCWKGTKDVGTGVFTGALASSAVLIPICMESGVSSKLFSDMAITLISANFLCLIGVFTIVPWLCNVLLATRKQPNRVMQATLSLSGGIVARVSGFADWIFSKSLTSTRWSVLFPCAVAILAFGSLLFMPPSELLPTVKAPIYAVTLPIKRNILEADGPQLQKAMSAALGDDQKVKWSLTTYDDDSLNATVMTSNIEVPISPILEGVAQQMRIDSNKMISYPIGPTPPTEPMNYAGYFYIDSSISPEQRRTLINAFCSEEGISDCTDATHYSQPVKILRNRPLSMALGSVNPIRTAVEGGLILQKLDLASAANLPLSEPVYMRLLGNESLTSRPFISGKNRQVLSGLGSLYDLGISQGQSSRFRYDLKEYEPLYFGLEGITIGEAVNKMQETIDRIGLPASAAQGMGGIQNMKETFGKMTRALTIAGILNFLILMLQFRSVVQTVIIMFSIPLAVGGSILGLLLWGETLNAGVIVGFVLLIGIVVNNGIMLMESMNQQLDEGVGLEQAIRTAVSGRTRPILMTAFGTVFGMLPTILFQSEGQELYRGMAIVNIFGMTFGSFLTLVVTPVLVRRLLTLTQRRQA